MIYPGAGRKVYPGFLQLAGFMTMNLGNHLVSHWEMFKHLVDGDEESADATKDFYDEYRSVCDMTAEFYLQTVDVVFQRHLLAEGRDDASRPAASIPAAITDTALLAIEGERDDISGIGQTKAALDIATRLPERGRSNIFIAKDVGHYGIFNGRKWRDEDRAGGRKVHRDERLEPLHPQPAPVARPGAFQGRIGCLGFAP